MDAYALSTKLKATADAALTVLALVDRDTEVPWRATWSEVALVAVVEVEVLHNSAGVRAVDSDSRGLGIGVRGAGINRNASRSSHHIEEASPDLDAGSNTKGKGLRLLSSEHSSIVEDIGHNHAASIARSAKAED